MLKLAVLAQSAGFGIDDTSAGGVETFLATGAGTLLKVLLAIAGFAFVLITIVNVVKDFSKGASSSAVKNLIKMVLVVPFLFAPELIMEVIAAAGNVVTNLLGSASDVVDSTNA